MGRKNIIIQINDLDLDHDQEYFEEHLHTENKILNINQVEKINDESTLQQDLIEEQIVNPIESIDDESTLQQDLIEEQIVTVEKPTKNSKKKNTNQESSS